MLSRLLFPLVLLVAAPVFAAADSPLTGTWQFDAERSTELSPWKAYDLTISVDGASVTLQRRLAWGRREFADTMVIDTARSVNVIPIEMWPDNRHLGAYIAETKTKQVRATWLDNRQILRLESDLTLSTQQGDRAVNILSDYKVSANGAQLTLTELRSTRNRPVVYVFKRAPLAP